MSSGDVIMHEIKLPADIVGPGFGVRRHTMPTMPTSAKQDAAALHGINGISQIHVKSPDINHLANGIAAESVGESYAPRPMTPQEAIKKFGSQLSAYEICEILDYPEIYFVGQGAKKIQGKVNAANNGGYDEESGDYIAVQHDHVAYRYEILETLGKGSFGQVVKAFDHKTQTFVALKCIRNKKRFHQQALVEVKVLDHIRAEDVHDNHHVVHMIDNFYFRSHLCITFELLGINLYELVKNNKFQGLGLDLIRKISKQMLCCLSLLRDKNIIHCDLKPENVLLKSPNRTSIKVIDFGSSCYKHEKVYTYIQSRFYRSPEVILGLPYDVSIDMWSFGCILAELLTGYPLFPGENENEQLAYAMEIYGVPPPHLLQQASRRHVFFEADGKPKLVPNSKGRTRLPNTKQLHRVLKCKDPTFLDLINRCLTWDATQRITPQEALRHPFFAPARPRAPAMEMPYHPITIQPRSAFTMAMQPQHKMAAGLGARAHPTQTHAPQYTQPHVMPLGAALGRGAVAGNGIPTHTGYYAYDAGQYMVNGHTAMSYGSKGQQYRQGDYGAPGPQPMGDGVNVYPHHGTSYTLFSVPAEHKDGLTLGTF